jgi:hypothetical protein
MAAENTDPTKLRAVYIVLLCAGYAYVIFFFLFMFRSIFFPEYFAH